jgi:indole-3-glycerol phosphate synthase
MNALAQWRDATPLIMVKKAADAAPPARDFVGALRKMEASWGMPGLIAEVKKASPRRAPLAGPSRRLCLR